MVRPVGARRTVLLASAFVVAAVGLVKAQALKPSFRVGVDVVYLNVLATDASSNQHVIDLDREDFTIFEDGVKQDVEFFSKTPVPVALALLLDTSASMEESLSVAQAAAVGFAEKLRPEDVAAVVDFDSSVKIARDFTSDRVELQRAIRQTTAGGSTALYNAIYIALKELRKRFGAVDGGGIRRQAVIVLSDGADTSSLLTFEEVLDLAKRSETAIYSIGLRGREPYLARGSNESEFVLRQLALQTGGRSFFVQQTSELGGVYEQVAEELASEYTLAYVSKNSSQDGRWRNVNVRLARPNTVARTRMGYYASGTTPDR
jgi:Ca-activated chloride channel family protein